MISRSINLGRARYLTLLLAGSAAAFAGCSIKPDDRPDLLVNEKYIATPDIEKVQDVDLCLSIADQNIKFPNKYRVVGKQALFSAIAGTVPGAIGGAIVGETPENVAVGAAVGAVIGGIQGTMKLYEEQPHYQRFVEHCLHKKGYEIIGWSS